MTTSPSDTSTPDPLASLAQSLAEAVGGSASTALATAKVTVEPGGWVDAVRTARDDFGLVFISWLSAIDWANDVAVGDPLQEETEERFEVLCALSDLSEGHLVVLSTTIPKDEATLGSVVDVFPGAGWHERETHEMFGISFDGNSDLTNLYLPDGFIGNPLRKSYPLLSREVKPWPGKVDVEGLPGADDDSPSTENPEA